MGENKITGIITYPLKKNNTVYVACKYSVESTYYCNFISGEVHFKLVEYTSDNRMINQFCVRLSASATFGYAKHSLTMPVYVMKSLQSNLIQRSSSMRCSEIYLSSSFAVVQEQLATTPNINLMVDMLAVYYN